MSECNEARNYAIRQISEQADSVVRKMNEFRDRLEAMESSIEYLKTALNCCEEEKEEDQ